MAEGELRTPPVPEGPLAKLGLPERSRDLRDKINKSRARRRAASSNVKSQTSIETSSRPSIPRWDRPKELDRIKEKIFNLIKIELGAGDQGPTTQYEHSKIAQ